VEAQAGFRGTLRNAMGGAELTGLEEANGKGENRNGAIWHHDSENESAALNEWSAFDWE
jgi:hypothetical protein